MASKPITTLIAHDETLLAELLPIDGEHFRDGDQINLYAMTRPRRVEIRMVRQGASKPYYTVACQTVSHFDRAIGHKLEELAAENAKLPPRQRRGTLDQRELDRMLRLARTYLADGELPLGQGPSRFSEAIERQVEIRENLKRPEIQRLLNEPRSDGSRQVRDTGKLALMIVSQGDPYYWSPEYVDLVKAASDSLDSFRITDEVMPSRTGFAWLGRPLPPVQEGDGHVYAVGWTIVQPDVVNYGAEMARSLSTDRLLALIFFGRAFRENDWNPLVPLGSMVLGFNYDVDFNRSARLIDTEVDTDRGTATDVRYGTLDPAQSNTVMSARWWCASLAFLNQKILVASAANVDRATRRRLERAETNVAPSQRREPGVRVIHLRKTVRASQERSSDAEKREVAWTCSWITRGHWREQPYRRSNTVKTIWIAPYPKGPADKPLRGADKLFVVDR